MRQTTTVHDLHKHSTSHGELKRDTHVHTLWSLYQSTVEYRAPTLAASRSSSRQAAAVVVGRTYERCHHSYHRGARSRHKSLLCCSCS
jgi:hypothetical protein